MNPFVIDGIEAAQLECLEVELYYSTEWDEFWSFVGNKSNTYLPVGRSAGPGI